MDPDDIHALRVETIKGEDIAWVILQGVGDIDTLRHLETAPLTSSSTAPSPYTYT